MKRIVLIIACLAAVAFAAPGHSAELNPTPSWMGIYGSVTFRGAAVDRGDEVRAYTPEGMLVGRFAIEKATAEEYGFMPIYGDDPTTPAKDGAAAGDAVRIVLYRVSDKQEHAPQHVSTEKIVFAASTEEQRIDLMF
jgi:hypothetical protein